MNALTEYAPTLLAPNTSARLTVDPDGTVAVAAFRMSVWVPGVPLDVDVFKPGDVVAALMLNADVSPLTPSTHAFWNVTDEVVRVFVTVQVTEPDAGAVNVAVFAPLVHVIVAPVQVNALTEYAPTLLAPNTSARLTVDPDWTVAVAAFAESV